MKLNEIVYALVRLKRYDSAFRSIDKMFAIYEACPDPNVHYEHFIKSINEPWSTAQGDRTIIDATKKSLTRLSRLMDKLGAGESARVEPKLWLAAVEDFISRESARRLLSGIKPDQVPNRLRQLYDALLKQLL